MTQPPIWPKDLCAADDALLTIADAGPQDRVAILAPGALELACALLRRGYRSVTVVRPGEGVPTKEADMVIVPQAASVEALTLSLVASRRILAPLGTIVLRLFTDGKGPNLRVAMSLLVRHGFAATRTGMTIGGAIMRAELPFRGSLKCA